MLVKALVKFHSSAKVGYVSEVPDEIAQMAIDGGMAVSAETLGVPGMPDPGAALVAEALAIVNVGDVLPDSVIDDLPVEPEDAED
jgi:hypothetical protein